MEYNIKLALEFLNEGKCYTIRDLRLCMHGTELLTVTGWSKFLNFSSLTKSNSLDELSEIKETFSNMLEVSYDLKSFIKDKSTEYVLCYDDGGKASIDICHEIKGTVKWKVELSK